MLPGDNKDNMPRPLKKGNIFLLQIINPPFSRGRLQKDIKTNCKNCQYSKCYHIIHYFKRLLPIPASAIAKNASCNNSYNPFYLCSLQKRDDST